jgi:hypothetical protein
VKLLQSQRTHFSLSFEVQSYISKCSNFHSRTNLPSYTGGGGDITCTCGNKMPFLQGGPFFSSEDLCECPQGMCVCRWGGGGGVELNWSFARSLSATSPTGHDGSFHRHPVDSPSIQAKTNKIQVQVTRYAEWGIPCHVTSPRFLHASCWFRYKCIRCKLSLSILFYGGHFSQILEKMVLTPKSP